jgi:uncharacterized iron-regulated membrane protein
MDSLHTWAGLIFGALLFLVFFMGTLSVFDNEIDRWMLPETRIDPPANVSFETYFRPHLQRLAADAPYWSAFWPQPREPLARLYWESDDDFHGRRLRVSDHTLLAEPGSLGGTQFFFPFHYRFHISWLDIGYWLLAVVSIAMLAALISGVIIHRKLFVEFFTFRPDRSTQRAVLDIHNLTSIMLLPFHLLITFSGLVIFLSIYFQPAVDFIYSTSAEGAEDELYDTVTRPPTGQAMPLANIDAMIAEAQQRWRNKELTPTVRNVVIDHPGDAAAVVEVRRLPVDQISYGYSAVFFDGATGKMIYEQQATPGHSLDAFFAGLHMLPFAHWGIRWLYFFMGIASCVMIGTGFLIWVEKRRRRQLQQGLTTYRWVNGLAAASVTGLLVATLAMLVLNRILPDILPHRASWEVSGFFAIWIATLAHAGWRARDEDLSRTWREHLWFTAVLALCAVGLNGVTTGDFLPITLFKGQWAVAGVDSMLLLTAAMATVIYQELGQGYTVMVTPAAPSIVTNTANA